MSAMHFPYSVSDFKIISPLAAERKRKINQVFLVEHIENGTKGILKHLSKTDKNKQLENFLRNEAAFDFNFSGLPQTYAFLETDHEIMLIKSYAEGVPLDVYWKSIPKAERLRFVKLLVHSLAPIMAILAEQGIVHGDLKPGNLILNGEGLDFELHLIDFGLAFRPATIENRNLIFSLGYSAPELILHRLHLASQASDIFSFGVCLYQLFDGKLPLTHANPAIMTNLQITHPLPESRNIPKKLHAVLAKCCAKFSFAKPPHLLPKQEMDELLQRGIAERYPDFGALLLNLDLPEDKPGLLPRLIKIFSKS